MSVVQHSFGWSITLETGADLSDATALVARIVRPGGSVVTKTLAEGGLEIASPATAGTVEVHIAEGDLSEAGRYRIQVVDSTPGRWLPSAVVQFLVDEALVTPP